MRRRQPVPFYYWPVWMAILGLALIVFYGFLTPIWMLIRVVAWVSERRVFNPERRTAPRAVR